jgi:hypothetical protein
MISRWGIFQARRSGAAHIQAEIASQNFIGWCQAEATIPDRGKYLAAASPKW